MRFGGGNVTKVGGSISSAYYFASLRFSANNIFFRIYRYFPKLRDMG